VKPRRSACWTSGRPLDDANVQRFCSCCADFSSGTQFLVITHNKRTMEVADRCTG